MVRRCTLKVDGFVFVLPEQVGGLAEYPFYGKVTSLDSTEATILSLSGEEPLTCSIATTTAADIVVTKAEATRTRQRRLLRYAAWTESAGQYWHGQVTGFSGRRAQLQLQDRVVLVDPSNLTEVAPVVALLLRGVPLHVQALSSDELVALQTLVLNRILDGSTNEPASNDIPTILDGLVSPELVPDPQSLVRWVDPRTGSTRSLRLQHAVDFAYTVDGGNPWPPSLRSSVGATICDDPQAQLPPVAAEPAVAPMHEIRDAIDASGSLTSLFAQDGYASSSHSTPRQSPRAQNRRQRDDDTDEIAPLRQTPRFSRVADPEPRQALPPQTAAPAATALHSSGPLDARVVEALLHQPEELVRYIQLASASQPSCANGPSSEPEPLRRTSKYAFAPTLTQAAIHDRITAPQHRGKDPTLFVESVIHSPAMRFKPHPGVITRLYDFEFGLLGLSLLHFAPFGVHQRMVWLDSGTVNMQNFSAGVAVPRPQPAASLGALVDAARTLSRYGQEFLSLPARDVVETLLDFLQLLDGWHSWTTTDLPHLVFWINTVLEQFRTRVQSDPSAAQSASTFACARLSLNDGELQNVMHALARRPSVYNQQQQVAPTTAPTQMRGAPQLQSHAQHQPRISKQIFDLIPKHNGRQICLRFLSVLGCASGSSDRCNYGARIHFVPDALDARVKGHIIQRMGGLGEQFSHL